ncbi:MAG TPA: hypothetical protein VMY99_05765 [Nevskiaceae bacterium]|nr:hypothetical protein [Nevskiaceae bacterium]
MDTERARKPAPRSQHRQMVDPIMRRPLQTPASGPTPSSISPPPIKPARTARLRLSKKLTRLSLVLIITLIAAGCGSWQYVHRTTSPIPRRVQQAVTFDLYYPGALPDGWTLDASSFTSDQGVVLYAIKGQDGNLIISIQARQQGFDYTDFYEKSMSKSSRFSTSLGSGAVGQSGNKPIGSIIINKSWILASSSSSKISESDIQFVLSNLKKS